MTNLTAILLSWPYMGVGRGYGAQSSIIRGKNIIYSQVLKLFICTAVTTRPSWAKPATSAAQSECMATSLAFWVIIHNSYGSCLMAIALDVKCISAFRSKVAPLECQTVTQSSTLDMIRSRISVTSCVLYTSVSAPFSACSWFYDIILFSDVVTISYAVRLLRHVRPISAESILPWLTPSFSDCLFLETKQALFAFKPDKSLFISRAPSLYLAECARLLLRPC